MDSEAIIKLRKDALEDLKKAGYTTQEDLYNDFYNIINYHPTDNYGRPIIVHNFDCINQGGKYRKNFSNKTEEYQLPSSETVKVGVTTSDRFILPGVLSGNAKYSNFSKYREYDINGLHCIILEMQESQNYRERDKNQTVLNVVFLVGTTSLSMVEGVLIPEKRILKLHYTEVSRIKYFKEIHKTFLDIYTLRGEKVSSIENVEIK